MTTSYRQKSAKRHILALTCLLASGTQSPVAIAQSNDDLGCAGLNPERSEFGYRRLRDRCEGFYLPGLSGQLQVVSFTSGSSIDFGWDEDAQLVVAPASSTDEPVHVRGLSLQRNVFYRMDAVIAPAEQLLWPVSPYLYRRDIRPEQLGVYGWVGDEFDKVFLPVLVQQDTQDAPLASALTLKVRTVLDLTHFRWSLIDSSAICQSQPGIDTFEYYEGDMRAGAVIELEIPSARSAVRDRCLEIQYRPDNQRWMAETLRIRI